MKCYLLLLPILLSGCGQKSYEKLVKLTPLPTPVALPGTISTQYPTPMPPSAGKHAFKEIEQNIGGALSPSAADTAVSQVRVAQQMSSMLSGMAADDPNNAERTKHLNNLMAYCERAAIIKRRQLEDGDYNDSTGEVAKYLTMARVCEANSNTLPPPRQLGAP